MKKNIKKNIYTHEIELTDLKIVNKPREEFRVLLEKINYRGYKVEDLSDGREIVLTKPGGKSVFWGIKREDFMVWIHNKTNSSLWLISHKDIYNDLEEKGNVNPKETVKIINALEKVYNGEEPDKVLKSLTLINPSGESPELLLKAYKWIWGQEDCNYPDGKGRAMSWEGWSKKKNEKELKKTGKGIVDLCNELKKR